MSRNFIISETQLDNALARVFAGPIFDNALARSFAGPIFDDALARAFAGPAFENAVNNVLTKSPIINHIVEKVNSIDTRLTSVEKDVIELKNDVKILKDYNTNEAFLQEQRNAQLVKSYLLRVDGAADIKITQFGKFYKPFDNNSLTDIDGCVIQRKIPIATKNRNGRNVMLDNSRVFLIESKHSITKTLFDKKLRQFVQILKIIKMVQTNKYIPRKKQYEFDDMIDKLHIKDFPENISFLLSSDKMSPEVIKLAIAVTTDTLTEVKYLELLFEYIISHKLMQDIYEDKLVDEYVKTNLKRAKNMEDLDNMFNPKLPSNATNGQREFFEKQSTILPYKQRIKSLVVPFDTYKNIIKPLIGKLGFIHNNIVQLPESVLKDGFNSTNILLNAAYNSN